MPAKARRRLSEIDEENEFLEKQYNCIKNNVEEAASSDERSPESIEDRLAEASYNPFSRLYHSNKDPQAEAAAKERLQRELIQQQERQRIQRLKEINKSNQEE